MQVSVSVLVDKVDERALRAMKRRNLQQVAKKVGVRANSTNELIITNILSALGGGSPHITNPLANPQPRETRSRSPSTSESDTGGCDKQMPSLSDFRDPMSTINLKTMATAMKDLDNSVARSPNVFAREASRKCSAKAALPCDSGTNPMQSVTVLGISHQNIVEMMELQADAETLGMAIPDEAVPSPTGRSGRIGSLMKILTPLKQKTVQIVAHSPQAETEHSPDMSKASPPSRLSSLRKSIIAKTALWASPKARARARTDEWLEAIARSPSRMMESTGPDSKTHTPTGRLRAKTFEDFLSFQPDDTNASILQQPSLIAESQQNQVAKKPGKLPVEMALMAGPIVSLAGPTQSERVAGGRGQVEDLRPRMEVLERGLDDLRKSQGDTFREMRRSKTFDEVTAPAKYWDRGVQECTLPQQEAPCGSTVAQPAMEASTTPVPRRFAGAPKTGNIISRAHRSPWQNMPRGGKPAASPYTKLFARPSSKTLKRPGSVKKGTRTPGPAAAEPARPSPSPSPRTGTNIPRAARLAKQVTIARPSPRPKQSASPKPIAAPCANLHQEPAKPVTPAELVVHGAESRGGAKPSREAPVFKPGGLKNGAKLIKGVPESPSVKPPPSCRPGTAAKCPAPKFKGPPRCASPSPWQNPQCKPTAPHVNAGNSRAAAPGAGHAMKPGPTQAKSSAKACWQSGPSIQCTPAHPATALTDPDTVSPSPKMPLFSSHFGEAAEELAEIVCPTPVKGHPFEAGDWGLAGVALCPAALRWEALPEMIRTRQNLDSLLAPWKRGQDTPLLAMLLAHEGSGRLGEALATEVQASYFVINSELLESSFVRGQERELLDAVFAKAMQPRRAVVLVDFLDHQPKGRAARELRTKLMQDLCFCLEACSAQPCLSVIVLVNTARPEMLSAELLKDIKHKLLVSLPDMEAREEVINIQLLAHSDNFALGVQDVVELARITSGYTVPELTRVCNFVNSKSLKLGVPATLSTFKAFCAKHCPSVAAGKIARLESWARSHAALI